MALNYQRINKIVSEDSFMRDGYYLTISKKDPRFFEVYYIITTNRTPEGRVIRNGNEIASLLIKDVRDGFDNYANLNELINAVDKIITKKGLERKSFYIDVKVALNFKESG